METTWIKISHIAEVPEGEWLGMLETGKMAVVSVRRISNGWLQIVGGLFSFDAHNVTHYCELPSGPIDK